MASLFPKPADFKPEPTFTDGRYAGKPRCQAWNHNRGQQCSKLPVGGKRVCKTHGGGSPGGADHYNYKGKGYSKYLPKNLTRGYQAWLKDPQRLTVEAEMALARSMVSSDMNLLAKNKSVPAWDDANDLYKKAKVALNAGKTVDANKYLSELGQLLSAGGDRAAAQARILENLEKVRRLVDTQRQIQVDTGEYMSRGQVILVLHEIITALREQLAKLPMGQKILIIIGERVRQITGSNVIDAN